LNLTGVISCSDLRGDLSIDTGSDLGEFPTMNRETELLAKQSQLSADIEAVNRKLALLTHLPPKRSDASDEFGPDEGALLRELSRLMDRLRAVEGALREERGQLKPLSG
jgi:hypothetical protein